MGTRMHKISNLVRLVTVVVLAGVLGACGGASKSPVAPSSATPNVTPGPTSAMSGATIDGTVVGLAGPSSFRPSSAGLTINVMGSAITVTVDGNGHFTIHGVPSGDVQLHLSGNGVNATLTITAVQDHESIRVTIRVSGSSATIDDDDRETIDHRAEVEGRITSIDQAMRTVTVSIGRVVSIPAGTPIRHGGTPLKFSDLKVGDRIHVHGTVTATGVTATEVEVQTDHGNPNPGDGQNDDNESELKGAISAKSGTCPTLSFTVASTHVTTNGSTKFDGVACSALANCARVDVSGTKQTNGSVLASTIEQDQN